MLAIDPYSVHLWLLDFTRISDQQLLASYHALLSDAERTRLGRFTLPNLQHNYLVTRAMVRSCLSFYADVKPQQWKFDCDEHGKPFISNADTSLMFNLSHSGGRAVLAVTHEHQVGVDVEQLSHKRDWLGIAKHYFNSSEYELIMSTPETTKCALFFRLWTLKEAYLKARGTGISTGLDKISFDFCADKLNAHFHADLNENAAQWQFFNYELNADYALSFALKAESHIPINIVFFQSWPMAESHSSNTPEDVITLSFSSTR